MDVATNSCPQTRCLPSSAVHSQRHQAIIRRATRSPVKSGMFCDDVPATTFLAWAVTVGVTDLRHRSSFK